MNEKQEHEQNRSRYENMLHALYFRIQGLKGRHYEGSAYHYSLVAKAGRLISDFSVERYYQDNYRDPGMRIVVEVCANALLRDVQRAELSAIRYERKSFSS